MPVMLDSLLENARLALERGDLNDAETLLQHCLQLEPDHGAAHHLLGKTLLAMGRPEEALHHQRCSCRCDPALGWNWFAAAELLQRKQRWREAADHLQRAADALPTEQPWIEDLARQTWLRYHCGGEDLSRGLGPAAYQYWIQYREPRLPDPAVPLLDPWWQPEPLKEWPRDGWLLLLGDQCRLRPGALQAVEQWLAEQDGKATPHLIYTDEDRLSDDGSRLDPWFKPGWCDDSFWGTPWLDSFSAWSIPWLRDRQLPLPPSDPQQRFRWILNALHQKPVIAHVAQVLVHGPPGPIPAAECWDRAAALRDHLEAGQEAIKTVEPMGAAGFRLQWALPPRLSCEVIIPTRDRAELLQPCLQRLWDTTSHLHCRVTIVDNGSQEPATQTLLADWTARLGPGLRVMADPGPFNWSRLNNRAARPSQADLLLFLNNDVEAIRPGWLEAMAGQALRPAIGCVGAVLTYPDGSLQHAGIVVGMAGGADHAYRGLGVEHPVHRGRSSFLTNWGAVTGACLMVRRELFLRHGGFDERLPVEFNDVDFCLRLDAVGYRHVVTPEAVLLHRESQSRDAQGSTTAAAALERVRRRWKARLHATSPWWPAASARNCADGRPREFCPPGWWLGDRMVGPQGQPWGSS
ncbi:glycosyltransferase [Synechococcus sp. CCY9202]|uniref:glycosyltransferase n=1 Tax=Synechococcus sp. CCY9202 TaxID=174698 RepID=UPI002B2108CF|nr:glycosyltransferase [Synechococcus sp. CCY9202]MEA5424252.1 glycosyltransferase [Synechococcus sp. CCY9202]